MTQWYLRRIENLLEKLNDGGIMEKSCYTMKVIMMMKIMMMVVMIMLISIFFTNLMLCFSNPTQISYPLLVF